MSFTLGKLSREQEIALDIGMLGSYAGNPPTTAEINAQILGGTRLDVFKIIINKFTTPGRLTLTQARTAIETADGDYKIEMLQALEMVEREQKPQKKK